MKTLLLLLLLPMLLSAQGMTMARKALTQGLTIAPTEGERFDYYMNGKEYGDDITLETKVIIKTFENDHHFSVWIHRGFIEEKELRRFMEYIDASEDYFITSRSYRGNYEMDGFDLSSEKCNDGKCIDMYEFRQLVKSFFAQD